MWKRSFVATTVALGGTVDEALAAIDGPPGAQGVGLHGLHPHAGGGLADVVAGLRSPQRAARAAALANAVRDIVLAIDQGTLR